MKGVVIFLVYTLFDSKMPEFEAISSGGWTASSGKWWPVVIVTT